MMPSRSWLRDIQAAFMAWHLSTPMTATGPPERLNAPSANLACVVSCLSVRAATCCSTRRRHGPHLKLRRNSGVPVFAHPIAPQPLTKQMAPYGLIGTLFARGAVNSAALVALVEGGVFTELPNLRVVFTHKRLAVLQWLPVFQARVGCRP